MLAPAANTLQIAITRALAGAVQGQRKRLADGMRDPAAEELMFADQTVFAKEAGVAPLPNALPAKQATYGLSLLSSGLKR